MGLIVCSQTSIEYFKYLWLAKYCVIVALGAMAQLCSTFASFSVTEMSHFWSRIQDGKNKSLVLFRNKWVKFKMLLAFFLLTLFSGGIWYDIFLITFDMSKLKNVCGAIWFDFRASDQNHFWWPCNVVLL
jgi:hypothetical protein